jgi:hypothetical protein
MASMKAVSSRRATRAIGAPRSTGAPASHLVLVSQPATDPAATALAQGRPAVALPQTDTAQPAGDSRQAFCAKLRAARERRGIPLSTIAAATKVGVSHLAALERNDLSRWPAGLYRRAWIRGYADAVGLPIDVTVDEFVAAFDPPPPVHEAPAESSAVTDGSLRLTLAATRIPAWVRLRTHAIDFAVAVLLAILVTWATGSGAWVAIGVLSLCAYAPILGAIKRLATKRTNA